MAVWAAIAVTGLLVAPHLLAHDRLSATAGIALFSSVLLLRAVLAICLILVFVFFVPATGLFSLLTHWCLEAFVPFLATHLGFEGHRLGDAAILVPALVTTVSLLSLGFGVWRGARLVKRWLARSTLGEGPERSVIVGGSGVVVAAAGLRSPKVVVSTGALLRLDDDELRAGLQHEWGHVVRRHRYVSLFGQGCRALSRFMPGGAAALGALELHLERDADDYAVRQTGDPLALASAICKAAGSDIGSAATVTALGGSGVPQRLRQLVRSPARPRQLTVLAARTLAVGMLAVTLALVAAGPTLAAAGIDDLARSSGDQIRHCH